MKSLLRPKAHAKCASICGFATSCLRSSYGTSSAHTPGLRRKTSFGGKLYGPPTIFEGLGRVGKATRAMSIGTQRELVYKDELDDEFTGLAGDDGLMTVAGFGSLLSERSARYTFPNLVNFRTGWVQGWRRVFAHTADVFFVRGIARPETGEISSLSLEPWPETQPQPQPPGTPNGTATAAADPTSLPSPSPPSAAAAPLDDSRRRSRGVVVSLFEVPYTPSNVEAFISREHEFRFVAVEPLELPGARPIGRRAVVCARNTDADYRAGRCPPAEWNRRWSVHGIDRVWRDDVLPCRVYLRHCVLAARSLGREAEESFLYDTYLADRRTTVGEHLLAHPDIMDERPPPELAERYNG
ncbi:hypothetical protein PLESTB_000798000 [Pleodorina starrii]|uniref:Uncharacterized protein n=1 Tax=Pleodorina starrii TaxID=330485 RepID=A0A9W6F2I2_9CHLO|nr:hypothetical protein PLESTM_000631800 [Pleodorina starrii]GLC53864.1 hypothetical protein PLESTB_000798000 [Pleodorina starrii]GLC75447.1 hypothetical protein PLESTF_001637800 [Pleodorina starrii]